MKGVRLIAQFEAFKHSCGVTRQRLRRNSLLLTNSSKHDCSSTDREVPSRSRRFAVGIAAALLLQPLDHCEALPLAPLGPAKSVGDIKLTNLTVDEVKDILKRDLETGQYFVTGDLTPEIFDDNCRFVDPTNDVSGLSRYITALKILFDPKVSAVKLNSIKVTGPKSIEAEWQLGGYLQFPWHPRITPFIGKTVYTLNDEGIIEKQEQVWSISGLQALVESFTPSW